MIESAVSSNRIEGITIDEARIRPIILGKPHLRERNEEEVRGYRNALKLIHEQGVKKPVSEATILKLHRLTRGDIWDAGHYKEKDGDIIERYPDGRERVRFKTVSAARTPALTVSDLERACPGTSRDMVRRVLRDLQKMRKVECLGRGPGALWRKKGDTLKKGY